MTSLMDGEELGSDTADTAVCFSVQNVSQLERLVEGRSAGTKNRLGTALKTGKGTDIWYSLEFQRDKNDPFMFTVRRSGVIEYRVMKNV